MPPSRKTEMENAVTQQPATSQRRTRALIAAVAVFGAVPAWAGSQPMQADAWLLRTATTASGTYGNADEADRLHGRMRQRVHEPRAAPEAPYGIGYEARRLLGSEGRDDASRSDRVERIDRIERAERPERPERVERPDIDRGGRGGR